MDSIADIREHTHSDLAAALKTMPRRPGFFDDLSATRSLFDTLLTAVPVDTSRVEVRTLDIDGPDGNLIPIGLYRPRGAIGSRPAILYLHGGAFAFGRSKPGGDHVAIALAEQVGAVVVSVSYRLAPEDPYPAGIEDCYQALTWAAAHAAELGIDPDRIAVTGQSAGGGLTAAVALMARDRGGPAIVYQSLYAPTLDDRGITVSAGRITDRRVLNTYDLADIYDHYLPDRDHVPAYAAPARATDLSGLPPAFVLVCELDPLRDEGLDYAQRLIDAGVPVTVHHIPGAWHIFEANAPTSPLALSSIGLWLTHLATALDLPPTPTRPLMPPLSLWAKMRLGVKLLAIRRRMLATASD
ncbi:alpha/beta hydrolase [Nocardia sp. NPDC050712]|uniref:alpha/beta hydrolase n=1 Tax=Nocardia sp. NPDC050712 TaxID=3155518 RepID=UPI0033CD01C9